MSFIDQVGKLVLIYCNGIWCFNIDYKVWVYEFVALKGKSPIHMLS